MHVRTLKNRDGYVFYEDQHYLRKVGTQEFFPYCPELAKRDDMVRYSAFNHGKAITKEPGVEEIDHRSMLIKKKYGLTREEIRDATKELNRTQRLLWAINLLFELSPVHDLGNFKPTNKDLIPIIGPIFLNQDVTKAIALFKTNPMHVDYLIREAADTESPKPEEQSDDPDPTTDLSG